MKNVMLAIWSVGAALVADFAYTADCTDLDLWTNSQVYARGDQVQYNSYVYRANWRTVNRDPETYSGQWQEWSLLGVCKTGAHQSPQTKEPAPVANTDEAASPAPSAATEFSESPKT